MINCIYFYVLLTLYILLYIDKIDHNHQMPLTYRTIFDKQQLRFKLTVTDSKNVTASEEVSVIVKVDNNTPPVARLGSNLVIYAPNTALDIDGSNSTDDSGLVDRSSLPFLQIYIHLNLITS